jgi:hypothetical protein
VLIKYGAPVGRQEVGARVVLLTVGLVTLTLRCILRSAQLMGGVLLIGDEGR